MDTSLNPYLNFNGNAAEAMEFYHSILGGELSLQTFEEAKMAQSPAEKDLIVHARLNSGDMTIMASDAPPGRMKTTFGDNVQMSIVGEDSQGLARIFDALANGGRVDMPLAKQFWGDTYGQLTDKFGVHWMVNIAASHPT